ncbi:MAG: NUDIX hydrolase [Clostridia bacterium]|nr:NUDIX hydrolase [Clostridia bacterium]
MQEPILRETLLTKETLYQGAILDVEKWQAQLPNGAIAVREIVRHKGAAAVVALDAQNNVLLVRQWRCPLNRLTLEIPAGKLDHAGEDPLQCAMRELKEETGYTAQSWKLLTPMVSTPGFCDERIHLYLAQDLAQGEARPDEDEFLAIARLPLKEAVDKAMGGVLQDAKTALGILMAWHTING